MATVQSGDTGFKVFQVGLGLQDAFDQIQKNKRIEDDRQEERDVASAADLLDQRRKFEADPDKVATLDQQFSGFNAKVRIKAAGTFAGMQRNNEEAMKSMFQQDYMDGLQKYKSAEVMLKQGRDQDAMNVLGDVMTKNIRDGYKHQYTKNDDGTFTHHIYKPNGELLQSAPVKTQDVFQQFSGMMARPDNAFKAYAEGYTTRIKDNLNEMNNMKEFRDKKGNVFYMHGATDPTTQEYRQVWYDKDGNIIERPAQADLLKSKEVVEKEEDRKVTTEKNKLELESKRLGLTKDKLDIEQKKLGIKASEKTLENEKEADRKRFDKRVGSLIEIGMNKAGLFYDEKDDMVYKKGEDLDGKPTKIAVPEALAEYKRRVIDLGDFVKSQKKKDESLDETIRRIEKEKREEAKKQADEESHRSRVKSRSEGNTNLGIHDAMAPTVNEDAKPAAPVAGPKEFQRLPGGVPGEPWKPGLGVNDMIKGRRRTE
jgi:hypothetical protein